MPKLIFGDKETIHRLKEARTPIQKMVTSFGYGPKGAKCGDCSHYIDQWNGSCGLYRVTHHTVSAWPAMLGACGKFQKKEPDGRTKDR